MFRVVISRVAAVGIDLIYRVHQDGPFSVLSQTLSSEGPAVVFTPVSARGGFYRGVCCCPLISPSPHSRAMRPSRLRPLAECQ